MIDDASVNIPEVVAEVSAAFDRYEAALTTNDFETMDALFWRSALALRYGLGENLYGYDAIQAFRTGRGPIDMTRSLSNILITTYGRDFATTNVEFRRTIGLVGRQSQTWIRTSDGWRIASAHVSLLPE